VGWVGLGHTKWTHGQLWRVVCSGEQKSRNRRDSADDVSPARRKLPPGGRLPPLNHRSNGATGRQQDAMYDDDDDDDEDDDEEEERLTD